MLVVFEISNNIKHHLLACLNFQTLSWMHQNDFEKTVHFKNTSLSVARMQQHQTTFKKGVLWQPWIILTHRCSPFMFMCTDVKRHSMPTCKGCFAEQCLN